MMTVQTIDLLASVLIIQTCLQLFAESLLLLVIYQRLYDEVMLKAVKSIWWNLKLFLAQRTKYFVTRFFVLEVALKTFKAERVETRQ